MHFLRPVAPTCPVFRNVNVVSMWTERSLSARQVCLWPWLLEGIRRGVVENEEMYGKEDVPDEKMKQQSMLLVRGGIRMRDRRKRKGGSQVCRHEKDGGCWCECWTSKGGVKA